MPALNSSSWRCQKPTVATILPAAAPTLRHSRTRPETHRKPAAQRPRTRFLQHTLWHAYTVCGMVRPWMPHWCWVSKVGW
jgi:hypothetical protein